MIFASLSKFEVSKVTKAKANPENTKQEKHEKRKGVVSCFRDESFHCCPKMVRDRLYDCAGTRFESFLDRHEGRMHRPDSPGKKE
jgi:hypothetical protein